MMNPLVMNTPQVFIKQSDNQAYVQAIMNLRASAVSAPAELVQRIKGLDTLLHDSDSIPNWRRGGGGDTSRGSSTHKRGPATPLNGTNRWKTQSDTVSSHVPAPSQNTGAPAYTYGKYESRFKNSDVPVEDTILNKIILNKLNKFSGSTYNEVRDFLYQVLDSGENNFTKEFMRLVFKKAAAEEIFCPLYAKLLKELRATYPVIQSEMIELFESYNTIFEDMRNLSESDYKSFVERNIEKKYRLGYSQFLAELVILEAVDVKSLEQTFKVLIENIMRMGTESTQSSDIQEYADCLLRMSRVLPDKIKKSSPFFINLRAGLFEILRLHLDTLFNSPKERFPFISVKARFALMDVQDNLQVKE